MCYYRLKKVKHKKKNCWWPDLYVYSVSSFILPGCVYVNIRHFMVLVLTNWTSCTVSYTRAQLTLILQKTKVLMGYSQLQLQLPRFWAHNPVWTKPLVWIHTLRGPWHMKYLYGCYTFQSQDLTCSDSMKLPQCLVFFRPLLRAMNNLILSQKPILPTKSIRLQMASVVTGVYRIEWKKTVSVLTHCTGSHSFPSGNFEYKAKLNSHSS